MKQKYYLFKSFWSFILFASLACNAFATVVTVNLTGNTFNPDTVNILVGDTVQWVNSTGSHTTTSDATIGPEVWDQALNGIATFQRQFNNAGSHRYYCSIHGGPGGVGMAGVVIVSTTPGIIEADNGPSIGIYPNPATDLVNLNFGNAGIDQIDVFNLMGQNIRSIKVNNNTGTVKIGVSDLPSGHYFCRFLKDEEIIDTRKVIIK